MTSASSSPATAPAPRPEPGPHLRLPRGRTLARAEWEGRHRLITGFVALQVPVLLGMAVARGLPVAHAALEVVPVVALLLVAVSRRPSRRVRALASTLAALTCSAVLVHVWDGAIEAHFHFFVTIAALAFYEDWAVFGAAFGYVLLHHGLLGSLDPGGVFAHDTDSTSPWEWALIHAGFIALQSALSIVGWRTNEDARLAARESLARAQAGERATRRQADTDELTGLPNRRRLLQLLGGRLEAGADRPPLAALFVDVDDFKGVNDRFGHEAGDLVLREVADRLRRTAGEEAVVGRLAGDEFLVAARVQDEADAVRLGRRLLRSVATRIELGAQSLRVGASVGVAVADGGCTDASRLVADADAAMYHAKGDHGEAVALWDAAMQRRQQDAHGLESDLRDALRDEDLEVAYQPIVDLHGRSIVAIEALARWTHPERGAVSPAVFVAVAERSALIHDLGGWILARAVADAARWGAAGHDVAVSVNVAPRQLSDVDFPAEVRRRLREYGLPAHRLWLEVTETALVADDAATREVLAALRDLGVRLAIDDFGAGASTFAQLRRLPSTAVLKLDRSLIADMHVDPAARALVGSVLDLAHALGLSTVAEGVEQEEQSAALSELACTQAQGYLFARPMPMDRLLEVLDTSVDPDAPAPEPTAARSASGGTGAPAVDAAPGLVPAKPEP